MRVRAGRRTDGKERSSFYDHHCMLALKLGFTSVMIDGSTSPVEENAALTQSVVEAARAFGVPAEAEIGELQRLDSDGPVMENKNTADPEQVRRFLELCSPDTLATGIYKCVQHYQEVLNTLNHQGHPWKLIEP